MGVMATAERAAAPLGKRRTATVSPAAPVPGRWPKPGSIRERWTVADLQSLPEDGLRYEIIDGLLLVSPSPAPLHQRMVLRVARLLEDVCPADCEVFASPLAWEPDEETSLEPDVLVMRNADVTPKRLTGDPLLVVEVLSRSSRGKDRALKFERYQRGGIPQYWIVDPGGATFGKQDRPPSVEVFDLVDGEYRLQARATGDETAAITGPLAVSVTPSALIS